MIDKAKAKVFRHLSIFKGLGSDPAQKQFELQVEPTCLLCHDSLTKLIRLLNLPIIQLPQSPNNQHT